MRALAALALLALLAAPGAPPAAAEEPEAPVQPGAKALIGGGHCTLNFVFRDPAGGLFVGTAGHCAERVGEVVRTEAGAAFGSVAYKAAEGASDVALIRVDDAARGLVSPSVRQWGGPVGVEAAFLPGTLTLQHGHGFVLGDHDATRGRVGVLAATDGAGGFLTTAPSTGGDSGSPVLSGDGRALGIIQGVQVGLNVGIGGGTLTNPLGTVQATLVAARSGPTVPAILADLRAAGFDVEVATAPFVPLAEQLLEDGLGLAGV